MSSNSLQPLCLNCGQPVEGAGRNQAVRCGDCFDGFLRSVDAGFLEHYASFGVRSRQVIAETCLRALVLANPADRKILGLTIYEQFIGASTDLMALVAALRSRVSVPIARAFMDFRLSPEVTARFFADAARLSGVELLATVGLPPPETRHPSLPDKVGKDVTRSLREVLADLHRLNEFRELGERALGLAAAHFRAGVLPAGDTRWLAGRDISPAQVASVAMDARRGRLEVAALRVDEARLEQVIDAIDVMTRLSRNLAYAFATLHDDADFTGGFVAVKRVHAG